MADGSPKNKHSRPTSQSEKLHVGLYDSPAVQNSELVHALNGDQKEPNGAQTALKIRKLMFEP